MSRKTSELEDLSGRRALVTGGGRAVALRADVSDPAACRPLIDEVVAELGGIDVLVCNAGVEHFASLDAITPDDFTNVFAINAVAPGGTRSAMSEEYGERYAHPALRDLPDVGPELLERLGSAVRRLAEPEEIAAAVAFLSAPAASYVTGSTLAVDGGAL